MKTTPPPNRSNRRLLGGTAAAVGLAITLAACGASKVSTAVPAVPNTTVAPASSGPAPSAASASTTPAVGTQGPATQAPAKGNTPVNGSRPGGGGTRGTIESINGGNLLLDEANGTKVNVVANATTAVMVTKPGSMADFKVGSNVVVLGAADANGVVAATTVSSASGGAPRPANGNGTPPTSNAANQNRPGGATRGPIVSVSGDHMVVADSASGKQVTVSTSAATKFTLTTVGALSDYKTGDAVVVQGTPDASGTITAVSIAPSVARGNVGGPKPTTAPATNG